VDELPLLVASNAGHLNELVTGRVVAPHILFSGELLQEIGCGGSPFATWPGDELAGSVLRIKAHAPAADRDAHEGTQLMAAKPPRRTDPAHLGAHIVPVERALLHRADVLDERVKEARAVPDWELMVEGAKSRWDEHIAAEYRALAAELHHW
jgi:hypothetical protein